MTGVFLWTNDLVPGGPKIPDPTGSGSATLVCTIRADMYTENMHKVNKCFNQGCISEYHHLYKESKGYCRLYEVEGKGSGKCKDIDRSFLWGWQDSPSVGEGG